MGRRGPAPVPTGVLRLRGTLRNDRVYNEPKVAGGVPKCPAWLSAEAKSAWKQLAPDLVASGLLTRLDRNALSRYCTLWARWRKAEEFIAQHRDVYTLKDARGAARCAMQFPQVAIAHRLSLALTRSRVRRDAVGAEPFARADAAGRAVEAEQVLRVAARDG